MYLSIQRQRDRERARERERERERERDWSSTIHLSILIVESSTIFGLADSESSNIEYSNHIVLMSNTNISIIICLLVIIYRVQ